ELGLDTTCQLVGELTHPIAHLVAFGTRTQDRGVVASEHAAAAHTATHEADHAAQHAFLVGVPLAVGRLQRHSVGVEELSTGLRRHGRHATREFDVLDHAATLVTAATSSAILTGLTIQPAAPAFLARSIMDSWTSVVRTSTGTFFVCSSALSRSSSSSPPMRGMLMSSNTRENLLFCACCRP